MPYKSKISDRLEYRPIASTILGAKGSDLMLIKLAKAAFQAASWHTRLDVGRYMLPLGENLRNVAPAHDDSSERGFINSQGLNYKV